MSICWRVGAALLVTAFLLAGGGQERAYALAAADLNKPCAMLSGDAVARVFGVGAARGVPQPPRVASNGLLAHFCEYRVVMPDLSLGELAVAVTDRSVTAAQVTEAWQRQRPNARPVAGVGEAAVYYIDTQNNAGVVGAAKSTPGGTVTVIYSGSPKATQEMLASLVKQAIDTA